ncbi:hypothetical protein Q5424_15210 [Conexibacter sp. JD483]|uniref:hypothetical protein n=1 Tax=unclassified Conexibacter TaxID=2627773 RepID=UPI002716ACBE|nr:MULTISPECIES: hypothetical protein [unclassified Conexibacter]MDO8188155.1 hypothetical protein [Conexibacter sp. CPCC 205706]MDO8201281.1 hypothetical protein [Conexibacter sp. CPCC 205762]MDR9370447.1 hypothetical protein [Conexibacter sp. JD483]
MDDGPLTTRCWQLTRPRTRQHLADALDRVLVGGALVSMLPADANGPPYVAARERNRLWHELHQSREALDHAAGGI